MFLREKEKLNLKPKLRILRSDCENWERFSVLGWKTKSELEPRRVPKSPTKSLVLKCGLRGSKLSGESELLGFVGYKLLRFEAEKKLGWL